MAVRKTKATILKTAQNKSRKILPFLKFLDRLSNPHTDYETFNIPAP
jgi:hypothetical protein